MISDEEWKRGPDWSKWTPRTILKKKCDSLLSIKIEDRGWVRVFSQHSGDTTIAKICLLDGSHKPIYNKERLFTVIRDFF